MIFVRAVWIGCLQFFIAEQVARSAWSQPYSFATNFISDLGMAASPWHALMNLSFILQGLLIGAGALLWWNRRRAVGLTLLVISGVGVIVVGSFPSDTGHAPHVLGAATHFLAAGLGIIVIGFTLPRAAGWPSIAVGLTVLAATLLLGQDNNSVINTLGPGTVERVGAYGIAGWMTAMGIYRTTTAAC